MPSKKELNKNVKWRLDPKDVKFGFRGSSTVHVNGNFERKLKTTSCTLTGIHVPTGIKVQGEIPPGNYSKTEMQEARKQMEKMLFLQLTVWVAKELKIQLK